jgi:hypothetical protein
MIHEKIISFISDKIIITMVLSMLALSYISYQAGLDDGFIPKESLCSDEITWLDQCHKDLIDMQKENLESLTQCKASCHLDVCKPICTRQVSDAINSYKKLMHEFKCGGSK